MKNFKLLCIKNFNSNTVPMTDKSSIKIYYFEKLTQAEEFGNDFLLKQKNSYIKILNHNTNEFVSEKHNKQY